jgi:hypothetical protein
LRATDPGKGLNKFSATLRCCMLCVKENLALSTTPFILLFNKYIVNLFCMETLCSMTSCRCLLSGCSGYCKGTTNPSFQMEFETLQKSTCDGTSGFEGVGGRTCFGWR